MRKRIGRGRLTKLRLTRALVVAVVTALSGCTDRMGGDDASVPVSGATGSVVDHAGRTHDFTEPAERIVSLVPSATATLLRLDLGHLIVGRTDFDDDPRVADVPSVGGGLEPNLEVLVTLRPDLVIRFVGEQDPTTPARLDELGIAHLGIRPVGLDDVFDTNALIGAATGHGTEADALSEQIRTGLAEIRADARGRPTVRVAYTLGGTPPWVSGPGTFVSEIIELAGGTNVFDDLSAPWSSVSREEFLVRDIDVVLVPDRSGLTSDLGTGVRIGEIGGALDQPDPHIVDAARIVFDAIHGSGAR